MVVVDVEVVVVVGTQGVWAVSTAQAPVGATGGGPQSHVAPSQPLTVCDQLEPLAAYRQPCVHAPVVVVLVVVLLVDVLVVG